MIYDLIAASILSVAFGFYLGHERWGVWLRRQYNRRIRGEEEVGGPTETAGDIEMALTQLPEFSLRGYIHLRDRYYRTPSMEDLQERVGSISYVNVDEMPGSDCDDATRLFLNKLLEGHWHWAVFQVSVRGGTHSALLALTEDGEWHGIEPQTGRFVNISDFEPITYLWR